MAKGKKSSWCKKVRWWNNWTSRSKITNAIKRDRRSSKFVDMQTIRSMTAHENFYRELTRRRDQNQRSIC